MTIIEFLLFFILLLIITAIAINGIFLASRPHEEVRPDGKVLRNGKVLQGWYYFWHKTKGAPEMVWFRGDEGITLLHQIKSHYRNRIEKCLSYEVGHSTFIAGEEFKNNASTLEAILDVKFEIKRYSNTSADYLVKAYREYPRYIFPEWVRDMMAACVTCHATVYGNVAFWVATGLVNNEYAWATNPTAALIASWVAFWLCLAYLNTWLFQRVKL